MKLPSFQEELNRLPSSARVKLETGFLYALVHCVHMLAYVSPGDSALKQLSQNVGRASMVPPAPKYEGSDIERLAQAAAPDIQAAHKLNLVVDVIKRSAQFQKEERLRNIMLELVGRYRIS